MMLLTWVTLIDVSLVARKIFIDYIILNICLLPVERNSISKLDSRYGTSPNNKHVYELKRKLTAKKSFIQRSFSFQVDLPQSLVDSEEDLSENDTSRSKKSELGVGLLSRRSSDMNRDLNELDSSVSFSRQQLQCVRVNRNPSGCNWMHVPYHHKTAPFAFMRLVPCLICRRKWVPETVLTTIEYPENLGTRTKGQLVEARVCRLRVSRVQIH